MSTMELPRNMTQAFAGYSRIRAWCRGEKHWRQGNLVGAYAEHIVARALSLQLLPPSHPGYDGESPSGEKFEIKGLFQSPNMWSSWPSKQAIAKFDTLAVVIFDELGNILAAHALPSSVVSACSKYGAQKRWWLTYKPSLWTEMGVKDLTAQIRAVAVEELHDAR